MSDATERHVAAAAERVGRYRWLICGLLFAATAINYVDRQMIGILKPTLQADLGWSETDYANIVLWFQAAYAIGYLGFGRLVDKIGARLGYAFAFTRSEEHMSELQSLMRISYAVFCLQQKNHNKHVPQRTHNNR